MSRVLGFLGLAAVFGAAAWVGHRVAGGAEGPAPAPAPPAIPGPSPRAAPPPATPPDDGSVPGPDVAAVGDLDAGGAPAAPPPPGPANPPSRPDGGKEEERPGAPIRLTFDDLMQWDLDPKNVDVPKSILAYAGKRIDLVGYMIPYGNPDAVEQFVLVNDLGSCCFGQAPQPHHLLECEMKEGKTTAYVPGPVRVRGVFRVREHRRGDYLISVYGMTVDDCVEVR